MSSPYSLCVPLNVSMQMLCKHVLAETNTHATIKLLAVFSVRIVSNQIIGSESSNLLQNRMEAWSNASTVALRIVGGGKKGT